jgi:hypothetical protein
MVNLVISVIIELAGFGVEGLVASPSSTTRILRPEVPKILFAVPEPGSEKSPISVTVLTIVIVAALRRYRRKESFMPTLMG